MESRKSEASTLELSPPLRSGLLERLFKLSLHGTTVKTELIAGLTTFITMAYIIFVQPTVLGAASGAVAGLVAITPAAGFVTPMAAVIIGALTMKMMSSTSMTSTRGVTLISLTGPLPEPEVMAMARVPSCVACPPDQPAKK